jgi:hypothetical protein
VTAFAPVAVISDNNNQDETSHHEEENTVLIPDPTLQSHSNGHHHEDQSDPLDRADRALPRPKLEVAFSYAFTKEIVRAAVNADEWLLAVFTHEGRIPQSSGDGSLLLTGVITH